MFEVVVSAYCPLVGKSVQSAKSQCWGLYNAVIYTCRVSGQAIQVEERKGSQMRNRKGSHFLEASFVPIQENNSVAETQALDVANGHMEMKDFGNDRESFGRDSNNFNDRMSNLSNVSNVGLRRRISITEQFYEEDDQNFEQDELGAQTLKVGDCLLIEAFDTFEKKSGSSVSFLSCRMIKGSVPPRRNTSADVARTWGSGLLLGLMVAAVAAGLTDILTGSATVGMLLVCMQCLSIDEAFAAIKGRVVLAIVMTYSLGTALKNHNVALLIAQYLKALGASTGPVGLLACMFLATALLSCIVSNQAAVILLYPVVVNLADTYKAITLLQFVIILMMGASTAFVTPVGYQTNLMVYFEGNYRFVDFVIIGLPLTIVLTVSASLGTYWLI